MPFSALGLDVCEMLGTALAPAAGAASLLQGFSLR